MIKKIIILLILILMIDGALAANYEDGVRRVQNEIKETRQKGLRMGNEPFLMANNGDRTGILLFHGFTASPWEVKELSEYLNNNNISVYGALIAGHGTSERDLRKTKWEDWFQGADDAYNSMSNMYDCIYVGGMSTGGALALMLAEKYDVCGVVSIGTPIYFQDWKIKIAWLVKYILPYTKRTLPDDVKPYYYEKRPVAAAAELNEMVKLLREEKISKIDEPIIIIQSLKDQTIKPESADFIMNNVSSKDKTFIWFDEGQHVIIKDNNREEVFGLISEFIHEQEDNRNKN